jgi:hypothetical protein
MSRKKRPLLHYRLTEDNRYVIATPSVDFVALAIKVSSQEFDYDELQFLERLGIPDLPDNPLSPLASSSYQQELLLDFCNITGADSLMNYMEQHDVPDLRWNHLLADGELKFSTAHIFQAAACMHWLLKMQDELANHDTSELVNQWAQISDNGTQITFIPTATERTGALRHWNGIVTLFEAAQSTNPVYPDRSGRLKKENLRDYAMLYLKNCVEKIVKSLRPTLIYNRRSRTLQPHFGVRTKYEATCLALYHRVSGASTILACRNPYCPRPLYPASTPSGRKPRSDKRYCPRPGCQRWCYDNLGPVRQKRSPADES